MCSVPEELRNDQNQNKIAAAMNDADDYGDDYDDNFIFSSIQCKYKVSMNTK
jgi:hypothetical protein